MHDTRMTLDEFEAHVDRHGAVLARWPADAAEQARHVLATSNDARKLLAEARGIAALLDEALPGATLTTGALRVRILARVTHVTARSRALSWLLDGSPMLRPIAIASVLIPLFLGYAIGVRYQPGGVNEDLASDVSLLAFADYETYSDAN